jgi:hypothetical protein
MSIMRMAQNITKRRKCNRPLTVSEADKLVAAIRHEPKPFDYKMSLLPFMDLFPNPYPEQWN